MNNDRWSSAAREAFDSGYLSSEIEEYEDDFVYFLKRTNLSLDECNQYYREGLDWERAPALPIAEWSDLHWTSVDATNLSDAETSNELIRLVNQLYKLNHAIRRADHLSDRRLYNLIVARVLPCKVKRLKRPRGLYYWDFCAFTETQCAQQSTKEFAEIVELTYYATDEERCEWAEEHARPLPPKAEPKYRRDFFPFVE